MQPPSPGLVTMPSAFLRDQSHSSECQPLPWHPQEALPELGHRPWAAGPGSPPSTHHPGLPGRSFRRTFPDSSLEGREKPVIKERCSASCCFSKVYCPNLCTSSGGSEELTAKCKIDSITMHGVSSARTVCRARRPAEGSPARAHLPKRAP